MIYRRTGHQRAARKIRQQRESDAMTTPFDDAHATAITAYAVSWGFLMKLGEKGILTPQEIIDALDFALVFLEQNGQRFNDPAAIATARQLVESLIKIVGEKHTPRGKPRADGG
jgi:hypothetical protein